MDRIYCALYRIYNSESKIHYGNQSADYAPSGSGMGNCFCGYDIRDPAWGYRPGKVPLLHL